MSRKDFERIAAALGEAIHREGVHHHSLEGGSMPAAWRVAEEVADALRGSNPNYDRARFMEAVAATVEKGGAR
jgi:hypothetical protein